MSNRNIVKSRYLDSRINISALFFAIFGSLFIISAEMAKVAGDGGTVLFAAFKQVAFAIVSLVVFFICSRVRFFAVHRRLYDLIYLGLGAVLIATRFLGARNGAYGWIYIGPISIQPAEFAKVFMILYGARMMYRDYGQEENIKNYKEFCIKALIYVLIIVVWQHDLGSGVVLFGICYVMQFLNPHRVNAKYVRISWLLFFVGILAILFILSPIGTAIMEKIPGYMAGRFLASANPFNYQYDSGYHLIMSLVSMANGGLFGLGFGNSIHKYMNFPNNSTDYILAVIIEEAGLILGFLPIVIFYGLIFYSLLKYALRIKETSSKMIILGSFMYLMIHFILNVGGISGIIPLTGVPLLLLSSGGSSWVCAMIALGIANCEIGRYKESQADANNSGQV